MAGSTLSAAEFGALVSGVHRSSINEDDASIDEHVRRLAPWIGGADFDLNGTKIEAGKDVGMWYPSANRDPEVFDRPYEFDITRKKNRHLAFGGYGAHFCLGANLARWELRAALRALAPILPQVELVNGPERCPNLHVSAIHRLEVQAAA